MIDKTKKYEEPEGCEFCRDNENPDEVNYFIKGRYINVSFIKLGPQKLMKVDILPISDFDRDFARSEAFLCTYCPNCGRRLYK